MRRARAAALAAAVMGLAVAGCASADKTAGGGGSGSGAGSSSGSGSGSGGSGSGSMGAMGSMGMGPSPATAAVRSGAVVLGRATWQGMAIDIDRSPPISFVVADGSGAVSHPAQRSASFQLMVILSDEHTGVAIPYATVRATISDAAGRVVASQREYPLLSPKIGSYYGDDVSLPGAGRYRIRLEITGPDAARHIEYAHVWMQSHTVVRRFAWSPTS